MVETPGWFRGLLVLPVLGAVLTLGTVVATGFVWWRREWSLPWLAAYSLVAPAAIATCWLLAHWNLLWTPG